MFSPLRQNKSADHMPTLILRMFRVLLCFHRCDSFNPPITCRTTVVRLILRIFRVLLCFHRCDRFNPPVICRTSCTCPAAKNAPEERRFPEVVSLSRSFDLSSRFCAACCSTLCPACKSMKIIRLELRRLARLWIEGCEKISGP